MSQRRSLGSSYHVETKGTSTMTTDKMVENKVTGASTLVDACSIADMLVKLSIAHPEGLSADMMKRYACIALGASMNWETISAIV